MSKSLKYDPLTRDLIKNGKGWFEKTSSAETTVMHQVLVHADGAWHDPQLGSFLHDLKRFQGRPQVSAPAELRRALNVLAARGRISNIEVTAEKSKPGRVFVISKCRDTSTGQIVSLKVPAGR